MPNYDRIPTKMQKPAKDYVEKGRSPGDFLQAVLRDSLTDAFGRADSENKEHMQEYVYWLYNDIPAGCWGSQEKINKWCKEGGLEGRRQE